MALSAMQDSAGSTLSALSRSHGRLLGGGVRVILAVLLPVSVTMVMVSSASVSSLRLDVFGDAASSSSPYLRSNSSEHPIFGHCS